jgi:hypothetical protein
VFLSSSCVHADQEEAMTATISLGEAEARLAERKRAAAELANEIEALSMITEGLRRLNGHAAELFPETRTAAAVAAETHPVGRAAVREVVMGRPGLWALREVVDEVLGRGWASERKSVEVAVHRMAATGEARRVRQGVYEFGPTTAEEAEAA